MYIYDSAWGADNATSSHVERNPGTQGEDRKSTRLNSSHTVISYAVFCLKKKTMMCPRAFIVETWPNDLAAPYGFRGWRRVSSVCGESRRLPKISLVDAW